MKSAIGKQLSALGACPMPKNIELGDHRYVLIKVFKHDFFAATALYQSCDVSDNDYPDIPAKIVLKMARTGHFLGLPLSWLGREICRHEVSILGHLQDIKGIPRFLGRYLDAGLIYEYIEGCSLDEKPQLPDDFFDKLECLIKRIHGHNIAYIDMNKRGNILLNDKNQPSLIDFQISMHIDWLIWPLRPIGRYILDILQKEDFYHLAKHKRRLAGHLIDSEQAKSSRRISSWIALHRLVTRPLTKLRRRFLYFLYRKGCLPKDDVCQGNPESDPMRWKK